MDFKSVVLIAKEESQKTFQGTKTVCGCGRAYVSFALKAGKIPWKVLESVGFLVTNRPYQGKSKFLYMGYDNADGRAWARAEAVAKVFTDAGYPAYADGDSD